MVDTPLSNDLKLVIEQTEAGKLLSRLTLEYPELANAEANQIQLALVRGLLESVEALAAAKAANPT